LTSARNLCVARVVVGIMHIGLQIKLARIAKGFTQQELADRIFKARPLISHIEQKGEVNERTLADIKKVLDMPAASTTINEPSENDVTPTQLNFLQQELEYLLREIECLKIEIEIMRDLIDTQKLLIDRLQS